MTVMDRLRLLWIGAGLMLLIFVPTYLVALDPVAGAGYPGQLWSYPPVALLIAAPFGLLPYLPALLLWTLCGIVGFTVALRLWTRRPPCPA